MRNHLDGDIIWTNHFVFFERSQNHNERIRLRSRGGFVLQIVCDVFFLCHSVNDSLANDFRWYLTIYRQWKCLTNYIPFNFVFFFGFLNLFFGLLVFVNHFRKNTINTLSTYHNICITNSNLYAMLLNDAVWLNGIFVQCLWINRVFVGQWTLGHST